MPKRVFWPAALLVMGLIYMASNTGLLPSTFWNFWPLLLIIVGLGGLLTSDREDWLWTPSTTRKTTAKPAASRSKARPVAKKSKRR